MRYVTEVCNGSSDFFFCILLCLQIRRALTFGQSDCRRRKGRQLTHAYVLNWAVLRGDWRSPINRIVWDNTMLTLLLPLFLFILIGKKRRCYGAERKVGSQGYGYSSVYRTLVVPLPSLVPLVRKDTRYLFLARLLFLQYYIMHLCL